MSGLYGPVDRRQAYVALGDLRPLLVGQDPLAIARRHEEMLRLDRHGRTGLFMTAVSAVDNALWDLRGKTLGLPVFRLLGGPTRDTVPAYASMLGHSLAPTEAARTATETRDQGFAAQKWFFRYGPADGAEGRRRNVAMAAAVREALGPEYRLMFDAFMGWDLPYALEMARALEPLDPFWLEEPLAPEQHEGFARLRAQSRIRLATGEHVYTRRQVRDLLVGRLVDVVQADPDWAGGITEQVHICSLCSAFDVPVIAHGHSVRPALHVAAAVPPATVPMIEYLLLHQERSQYFHRTVLRPSGGSIAPPEDPGLGIVLDPARIERTEELDFGL